MDLDETYMDKRYALDREREEIERNVSMAHDTLTGKPYSLEDPDDFDLYPAHRTMQKISSPDTNENEAENGSGFHFINDRPIVAGLNLAHRKHHRRDRAPAMDPMTDIKRRERFL